MHDLYIQQRIVLLPHKCYYNLSLIEIDYGESKKSLFPIGNGAHGEA